MSDIDTRATSVVTLNPNDLERPSIPSLKEKVELYNAQVDIGQVDEKALVRKLDLALVPWPSFLYLLTFLGRTSVGNAKLYGLDEDLGLSDSQYLLSLTIFFISYALFEVPSNVLLKKLRPSIWLSLMMFIWGLIMLSQAFVRDFPQLMAVRWLLGMFEAGLFPGVSYYLSCWYKRSEYGLRAAWFFSAGTIAGAFGGLLAAAISKMDGIAGKPAWAWIFILEGILTVIVSTASFWIIQDFPETAKFLTEAERTVVIRRLQSDNQFSAGGEKFRKRYLWQSLKDWKTWIGNELMRDLLRSGIYPTVPNTIAWISNNVEGSYKRSVSLAMVISLGNINGAVGSNIYRAKDRPYYTLGHGLVLMYLALGMIFSGLYLFLLKMENARRDRGERDEIIGGDPSTTTTTTTTTTTSSGDSKWSKNGSFATVAEAKREKGDLWSGYRYVL
ncbi:hypothetical protein CC1G_05863 [Coprinopsis cinerea okayama7|uniref:Major facilitator superfamily (MFS) profile domain-containing protein n=1 Tax=Coprinopsis cinerea (strain Okayama-7 / 130 / ATCC MYA-4618 / FGSC 9003) TaxID=240176 RepID=A8NLM3_COPC7|nr:hypothetical protein CC1G_05863 [Coprinopsis cinerea okayama7\|eukprot:XP_001834726.2 hypothetical protein CC1G_05863 [Coprinopsis cinerea okayama7\